MENIYARLLILLSVTVLVSCQPLQNEGGSDWITVQISLKDSSEQYLYSGASGGSIQTSLILAVPELNTTATFTKYLVDHYDRQLQNLMDSTVSLSIPLNTSLRLLKVVFVEAIVINEILNNQPTAYCLGTSQPFVVTGSEKTKTIGIPMSNCLSTVAVSAVSPPNESTGVSTSTDIAIEFNTEMNAASVLTNTSDTSCFGSYLLSEDNFSSCVQMSADAVASNNDKTFTINPNSVLTQNTTYQVKVTTQATDISAVPLADEFVSSFTTLAYSANGTLDTSFNSVGFLSHHDAAGGNDLDYGYDVSIDSDGSIYAVGKSTDPTSGFEMTIWKYTASGTLDTTFGSGGIVHHDAAAGASNEDIGYAMILDADGKILVAGTSDDGTDADMALWRYNSDGTLDTTFGSPNGFVVHTDAAGGTDTNDYGQGITMDNAGKILVVGYSMNASGNNDMIVWRYDPDGTLDTTFGTNGIVQHNSAAGGNMDDFAYNILVDADSKILIVGDSSNGTDFDMAVLRFNPDGSLDTTFNSPNGFVTYHNAAGGSGDDGGNDMTIDSNGNILITGLSGNGVNDDMVTWRYTSTGSLDNTFGTGGIVVVDNTAGGNGFEGGIGIAIDAYGKILVIGFSESATDDDMAIWRFNSDGTPDNTFGAGGYVLHDNAAGGNGQETGEKLIFDKDGKIVSVGASHNGTNDDLAIWRYE